MSADESDERTANVRLCWFCRHFDYDQGSPGYSELTPGEEASIGCLKDKWRFNFYHDDQAAFAAAIQYARKCDEFDLVREIVERAENTEPLNSKDRRFGNWQTRD